MSNSLQARGSDLDHLAWLSSLTPEPWSGKRILDLGCGSGFVCQEARRRGASYALGLDLVSPAGLAAQNSWDFARVNLDAASWPEDVAKRAGQPFDTILAFDIVEHVSSPWALVTGIHRLLAPGGRFIVTTPNVNSWERLWRPEGWSGVQDPQHKTLFNAYSLRFLLAKVGFTTQSLQAPVRQLRGLNRLLPPLGGQLFCVAEKSANKQ